MKSKVRVADIKELHTDVVGTVLGGVANAHISLPLYSSRPQAGFPSPGDDYIEKILDINDLVVKHPASTFFVRVEGDSMEGVGIFSGDVLVVDRSLNARDASIVVAALNGEMVVKRLQIQKGIQKLVSENSNYMPILIGEEDECFIWGVVVGSVRQFA